MVQDLFGGIRFYKNIFLHTILLNLAYMVGMVLCFEPFLSITDFQMEEIYYGAYTGVYNNQTMFEQFLYGDIIVFLIKYFPSIPWYSIVFYIILFVSFSFLTYSILTWNSDWLGYLIVNMMLLFFSYEGYIYIHFTKVAGIAGAVGFLLLFQRKDTKLKSILHNSIGALLAFFSFLIRYDIGKMLLGIWGLAIIGREIVNLIIKRKIEWKNFFYRVFVLGFFLIILLLIPECKYSSEEEAAKWKDIFQFNAARVYVQDYVVPDYKTYQEKYGELGISENDLKIWNAWNDDCVSLTKDKTEAMSFFENVPKTITMSYKEYLEFFKFFPLKLCTVDVFFAFMIIVMLYISTTKEKQQVVLEITCVLVILIGVNYYLFINKRFLQHRVDVSIIFTVCLVMMWFMREKKRECGLVKINILCSIIICLCLSVPFQYYNDDKTYISDEMIETNRIFYENTCTDEDHYYLIGNSRWDASTSRICYKAFDIIPKGIKRNIIMGITPQNQEYLNSLGIFNPFVDIVDNEVMYLVLGEDNSSQELWEKYFEEHLNIEEVNLILVKKWLNRCIYRVDIDTEPHINNTKFEYAGIFCDAEFNVENGKINISGIAYIDGKTGFSQNIYIRVTDNNTNEEKWYYTLQQMVSNRKIDEAGAFSKFTATIDEDNYDGEKIDIIVEDGKKYYVHNLK